MIFCKSKSIKKLEGQVASLQRQLDAQRGKPVVLSASYEVERDGDELVAFSNNNGFNGRYHRREVARAKTPAGLRKILSPQLVRLTLVNPKCREEL